MRYKNTLADCPDCLGDNHNCPTCEGLGYIQTELKQCGYCHEDYYAVPREWHSCALAAHEREYLNGLMADMHEIGMGRSLSTLPPVHEQEDRSHQVRREAVRTRYERLDSEVRNAK